MPLPPHLARLALDCDVTAYRSSGPGGQKKNKTESSVRVRHLPTGITRIGTESRSQGRNRERALERVLAELPQLKPLVDIPRMAEMAGGMLHEALDAFVRRDAETARRICRRDDEVDGLNRQLFRELVSFMIEDPATITRSMELILVARNLERVADLATNVAEEVVFIAEARVIKHHAEESAGAE